MLMRTPSEPGSTSFFLGNQANAVPRTLNAGKPNVVPSSTSGSFSATARTRERLSVAMICGPLRFLREEPANLLHGVVDLQIEEHLAQLGARTAGVADDAVARGVRSAAAAGIWQRLANGV